MVKRVGFERRPVSIEVPGGACWSLDWAELPYGDQASLTRLRVRARLAGASQVA